MSLRIYLCAPFPRAHDLVRPMMKRLRDAGHTITCDWTEHAGADPTATRRGESELSLEVQQKHARADLKGVRTADLVWGLGTDLGGTGMWVELGFAMALRETDRAHECARDPKRVPPFPDIVYSGPPRTIFTSLPGQKTFADHDEALAYILTLKP
jgi:hypothetical protein